MSKFWDSIFKFLGSQPQHTSAIPFIHEMYRVSEEELKDFAMWTESKERKALLRWIQTEFSRHQHEINRTDMRIDFLDTVSAKGFVIYLDKTGISSQTARHLLRFFMEKIKPYGYLVYMSDVRSREKNGRIEKTLRHYLKPRLKYNEDKKLIKLFGNISLEVISFNGQDAQLRFSALTKRDHSMNQAMSINQLYEAIMT
jgi:hypothetical protein